MKLLSVNVGLPREVDWDGRTVRTSIYKHPVEGRAMMRRLNIEGDAQSDLTFHGGVDMAVYAYAFDHYPHWQDTLKTGPLPHGAFGENLTVTDMTEDTVHIGDVFAIGDAVVQVSEPRTPCFKLGMKFNAKTLPKIFLKSGRVGFYFRVLEPGMVGAGDAITPVSVDPVKLTVLEALRLWEAKKPARADLERALSVKAMSAKLRGQLTEKL
jgi:MOSC domain-containing protein YiiM